MNTHMYDAVKAAYKRLDQNQSKPMADQHKSGDSSIMGKRNIKNKIGGEDLTLHYMKEIRRIRGEL